MKYRRERIKIVDFDDEPPFDMNGWTNWEKQEVRRAWETAMRESAALALSGIRLGDDLAQGTVWDRHSLIASGPQIPLNVAQKVHVAVAELTARLEHIQHRLAIQEEDDAEA